jgi:hypothetical protein
MFCADCGTRIRHTTPGEATISIKGGSLDSPPTFRRPSTSGRRASYRAW